MGSSFFFQAEDGIRDFHVTGVQTCALPICSSRGSCCRPTRASSAGCSLSGRRSEEHTSELQSRENLVCRLLLEKKKRTREHVLTRGGPVDPVARLDARAATEAGAWWSCLSR